MLQSTTDEMDALRSKVNDLSEELTETKDRLAAAQAELAKSEKLREEAEKSCLDLRKKVSLFLFLYFCVCFRV